MTPKRHRPNSSRGRKSRIFALSRQNHILSAPPTVSPIGMTRNPAKSVRTRKTRSTSRIATDASKSLPATSPDVSKEEADYRPATLEDLPPELVAYIVSLLRRDSETMRACLRIPCLREAAVRVLLEYVYVGNSDSNLFTLLCAKASYAKHVAKLSVHEKSFRGKLQNIFKREDVLQLAKNLSTGRFRSLLLRLTRDANLVLSLTAAGKRVPAFAGKLKVLEIRSDAATKPTLLLDLLAVFPTLANLRFSVDALDAKFDLGTVTNSFGRAPNLVELSLSYVKLDLGDLAGKKEIRVPVAEEDDSVPRSCTRGNLARFPSVRGGPALLVCRPLLCSGNRRFDS